MSYVGEIRINDDVKLSGFRAGGLVIKVRQIYSSCSSHSSLTFGFFLFSCPIALPRWLRLRSRFSTSRLGGNMAEWYGLALFAMHSCSHVSSVPQDCIVLTVHPPEPAKCPFTELRMVVPVRLTTDSWSTEGNVLVAGSEYSIPSSPSPDEGQFGPPGLGTYRDGSRG